MNKQLLSEFLSPGSLYRSKPFWAWNGKLDTEELQRQVRIFHKMGMGGFFMHSRVGLETEYLSDDWFECINACIDEAQRLGMEAWLYDEDRWPSGPAGGLVTKNPKYRMQYLAMEEICSPQSFQWDSDIVAVFTAEVDGCNACNINRIANNKRPIPERSESILVFRIKTAPLTDYYNGYTYLDTLSHEAVREFINVTHEAYREKMGKHFGKTVPGIFTDEPQHGGKFQNVQYTNDGNSLPWTQKLPSVFKQRYGFDILEHLPELFLDVDNKPITPARHDYHDCVTHLFVDAFARQIGEWCDANNLQHTGHVLMEDSLSSQASVVGSCMRFYEYMQVPGMDVLTEYSRSYNTAKQVSSAARQFGRKWRLTETYGCTGWDFPFAGHKAIGDWQVAMGINLRCQHLSLYTMEGEAKRDYPASISYQSPWWEAYGKVEDYFARIHAVMTRGHEVRDLLVVHPVESSWMYCNREWMKGDSARQYDNGFFGLCDALLVANIDFDYGDEDILARHGKIIDRNDRPILKVGEAEYTTVLVPPLRTMRGSTLELLRQFRAVGGTIVFAGVPSGYLDAIASTEIEVFAKDCISTSVKDDALVDVLAPHCRRISITDNSGQQIIPVLHLLREDDDAFYIFICNTGHDFRGISCDHDEQEYQSDPQDISVSNRTDVFENVRIRGFQNCGGHPVEMDPDSGRMTRANAHRVDGEWEIMTALPVIGSRLFVVPKKENGEFIEEPDDCTEISRCKVDCADWEMVLSEPNVLVLDMPRYKMGGTDWQPKSEILQVDRAVRDRTGIPLRGGYAVQPWARKKEVNPKSVLLELAYDFTIETIPSGEMWLGLERPELYRIAINGVPLRTDIDQGWWVDKSLRKLPFASSLLRVGRNEVHLSCDYSTNHPGLEMIYLLGNFGIRVNGGEVVMTELPSSLALGDWVEQGLAFYSGSVGYKQSITTVIPNGQRLFVRVPEYDGVAVQVQANGESAGLIAWAPNEIDITDFVEGEQADIVLTVLGHRRNSHGPLHLNLGKPGSVGPYSFVRDDWTSDYKLVPCGLMKHPELILKSQTNTSDSFVQAHCNQG